MIGDERPYLVALVSPSLDADKDALYEQLRRLDQGRSDGERVKKYQIVDERFSVENGTLSRAFKLNRARIKDRYEAQIEELYAP